MTDVPGIAGSAVDQVIVENEPTADAGRYHHAQHVPATAACAPPVLARGHSDRVVVHPDRKISRDVAGEPLPQPVAQREVAPAWDVERGDQPGRPLHRPA